ncbi:hypothetical protein GCM10023185_38820 [Hymenobacter saemangeumensis]|uniref:Fibronectin type-III domain-containing protein n=2 Tax=Hymenobacter saemangeumensis TaxID=1084522 RepID=A0ABP8IR43_9BACT
MDVLATQLARDPSLAQRMASIDNQALQYAAQQANLGQRTSAVTITIPVVVHVLYNTTAQNVTDAQIASQIDVLNEDFQKLNADVTKTPSAFAGSVADVGIAFTLAKRDPNGNATTGITRKQVTQTSWGTDDKMKSSTTGGTNAWNTSQYLNIWVCNLSGGVLGYAQFPGGAAATDGVVILTTGFGRYGSAAAPFNLGRTATHEVGHWLNLRHIWGDASCGNDYVSDTPTQQTSNTGCPTFPKRTCGNTTNGDMFMNYMDYTDDACMYMFSNGQSSRMNALFATGGARESLKTSLGGTPPSTSTCATPTGLAASSIGSTSATVSWAAASGAASYNLQYRVSGASTWTTVNQTGTSRTLSGLTASTTYQYQVQTVCSGSSSAYSAAASFTTTSGTVAYCASKGSSVTYEWIDLVQLGSINRSSGADAGYYNGTALSTGLTAGTTNTIYFSAGFSGTAYTEYFKVYIDYNKDGDFIDAGELVVSAAGSTSASTRSASFTVPTTARNGSTRMRVVMSDNSATTSCNSYSYGETEDYTVSISGGAARTSVAIAAGESNTYSLYPNPASDVLNIVRPLNAASQETALTVRVYDLRGSEVRGLSFDGSKLNVASLNKGIYMLTVSDGTTTSHQRFVKE